MLKIINGTTIEYTKGDTFDLEVSSEDGFDEGSALSLVISKNEHTAAAVENRYSLNSEGVFLVTLSQSDKEKFSCGEYIYKLVLMGVNGTIYTQKSGDFVVKWGA